MRRKGRESSHWAARLLILVMVFCCVKGSMAQSYVLTNEKPDAQQAGPPRFEDFPASKTFKGNPARPQLSSPQARNFRTRLREGAKKGPNFAGHYTIVTWGCGSSCQELAIVDARTGRVYFPKALSIVTYRLGLDLEKAGLKYQLDSRLLILVGTPGEGEISGTFYYKWENNQLKLIHSVKYQ